MILDRQHGVIVYDGADALKCRNLLPAEACRPLHNGYVAIPARSDAVQWLRRQNIPVPALIPDDGWPGQYPKPFKAQHITANYLISTPRCFVLSDMGTGKTLAALMAADYLMTESKHEFRVLIVTPRSTMSSVWGDAIFQTFFSRRLYKILRGGADDRRKKLAERVDFYIINYEGLGIGVPAKSARRNTPLTSLAADLAERKDIQLVIIDEATAYRDAQTARHAAARRLFQGKKYLWLMTGTPTSNAPTDAYGLAKLLNGAFGESFRSFRDRTMTPTPGSRGPFPRLVPRLGAEEAVRKLLAPAIRFAISDCMDLPPCTVERREVELSEEQKRAVKELRREAQLELNGKTISAVNEAALRWKFLQICCGAVYDGDHLAHELDATPRLTELETLVEQAGRKIIVFAPLTSALNLIKRRLSGCVIVNGQTTDKERKEIFDRFQRRESTLKVIAADPRTMAHGLTLTEASVVVWYAPIDRTESYLQANKRIDRPGQTVPTTIVQISASPIEREIYRRLESNQSMQGAILKLLEDR